MRGLVLIFIGVLGLGIVHAQTPTPTQTPTPSSQQEALGSDFLRACWSGDLNQVTLLYNKGAPLEEHDDLGRTPLFLASHGDPDVVKFLLAHGARIDAAENDGDLPIAHACEHGDLASAQMLLDAGAETQLGHVNQYGRTALMMAAREGHDALVSLLIAHHVDVNQNGPGGSAIWYAVAGNKQGIVKQLLEAGADMNLKSDKPVDPKNPRITLLSCAVGTNDLNLIDLLLAHGADINGPAEDGSTPLWIAVGSAGADTALHLIDKGADVNRGDDSGVTPLMVATTCKDIPILQALLQHGAKLETIDKEGRTALMCACHGRVTDTVQFLIGQGAKVNVVDVHGETALTYAGDRGGVDLVQYLRDNGATPKDFHIIAGDKPEQPLSAAHSWALAVAAIYTQHNGDSHLLLGGGDVDKRAARGLSDDWDITDKKSLLKQIDWLTSKGHRVGYRDVGARLAALDGVSFSVLLVVSRIVQFIDAQPDVTVEIKATRTSFLRWKERSGLAWDLCRRANLINQGYAANYLSETEAWEMLMAAAQQVQSNFSSWREMSDNFLDGREIWDNKRDSEFEACARLLLNPKDPNSPWNQLSWQTNLSAN